MVKKLKAESFLYILCTPPKLNYTLMIKEKKKYKEKLVIYNRVCSKVTVQFSLLH